MNVNQLDKIIAKNILEPKPMFIDVQGAPFKIGDVVLVLNNPNSDETFDLSFIGTKGKVEYFEYDCGCSQTFPDDPMIGVRFPDNTLEEFWKEELELVRF